jgi:hypothetical protein
MATRENGWEKAGSARPIAHERRAEKIAKFRPTPLPDPFALCPPLPFSPRGRRRRDIACGAKIAQLAASDESLYHTTCGPREGEPLNPKAFPKAPRLLVMPEGAANENAV